MRRPRRKRNKTKDKKASTSDENEEDMVTSWMKASPKPISKVNDDPRPSSEQFAFSAHPLAPCASSSPSYHTLPLIYFL